jgi:hypothetical protein
MTIRPSRRASGLLLVAILTTACTDAAPTVPPAAAAVPTAPTLTLDGRSIAVGAVDTLDATAVQRLTLEADGSLALWRIADGSEAPPPPTVAEAPSPPLVVEIDGAPADAEALARLTPGEVLRLELEREAGADRLRITRRPATH